MLRTPATPSLIRSPVPVAIGHAARLHSMPTGIRFAGAVHTLSALESGRTSTLALILELSLINPTERRHPRLAVSPLAALGFSAWRSPLFKELIMPALESFPVTARMENQNPSKRDRSQLGGVGDRRLEL